MKNRRKTVLCFLLVLCLTAALFPASASAAAVLPDPDVLVAVDPDSISSADAEKLCHRQYGRLPGEPCHL